MKTLIVLIACLGLSGCAALERMTNTDGMTKKERREAQIREIEEERKAIEETKMAFTPGISTRDLVVNWGQPDSTDFMDGVYTYHYRNDGDPVDFVFKNDKLTGWKHDTQSAAIIQSQKRNSATQRHIAEEQANRDRWNAVGNALSNARGTSCTTTRVGGTAYTNCR